MKTLIKKNKCIRILEAHSALSAKIVEEAGFDGIWLGSLCDSAIRCLPDIELVSLDDRIQTINQIRNITDIPIIIDCDTGTSVERMPYWIKSLENAKVNAIVIEDKTGNKRNSLDEKATHKLEDVDSFCDKIKAGKSESIMLIARLESLIAKKSMYNALLRAEAYIEAGVDGIMIHSKQSVGEEVLDFAKAFRKKWKDVPLMCVPTTYNFIYDKRLEEVGFNIICHANHLLRASMLAMRQTAEKIYKNGRTKDLKIASVDDIFKITNYVK